MKTIIFAIHKIVPSFSKAEFDIPENELDADIARQAAKKYLMENIKATNEELVQFFSYTV